MQSGPVKSNETIEEPLGDARQNFGRGLYLLPAEAPGGRRGWRFDYQFKGKRKTLSLGVYPTVTIEKAQDAAGAMRESIEDGLNRSQERRKKKVLRPAGTVKARGLAQGPMLPLQGVAAGSFRDVAERWYAGKLKEWTSSYAEKVRGRLKNHLFPRLGRRPVGEIEPKDLIDVCKHIEASGTIETARCVCKIASGVLSLAVVEGWAQRNFFKEVLDQLGKSVKRNFAAITAPRELAGLLKAIDSYHGTFIVRCALQLAPLLMLRPSELRQTLWSEIDLDNGIMLVPAERMKRTRDEKENGEAHVVPLARQAVEILERLFSLTGRSGVVFPCAGRKGRFLSDKNSRRNRLSADAAQGYESQVAALSLDVGSTRRVFCGA